MTSCCGWFSDRSLCYLASGRPVLRKRQASVALYLWVRDYSRSNRRRIFWLPSKKCERTTPGNARAARAIAEGFFDSDKVLSRLIDRVFTT